MVVKYFRNNCNLIFYYTNSKVTTSRSTVPYVQDRTSKVKVSAKNNN